ncbi:hypothetical protein Tco_1310086 [Tanacetum coccineum]
MNHHLKESIQFGKRGKLYPRYIGSFKILKRIGPMAYKLELPEELSNVHSTFHISNLKKCLSDESHVIPMKELRLDDKLKFVEEPVDIMDQEVKQLKQSHIPIIKDALSSMNILNYTSVSPDYFPASAGSRSFNSLKNSTDNIIPPVFLSFYNNPCLKDVRAFYAKELPISSPDPITPPDILTPSPVLPPSLLFSPRYFFVPEELLPPKKRTCSLSSSSTTLSNSSWKQTCDLVSPSSSVYTPTLPQVFEIGKCSDKMYLKHHEKQVKDILNYLDELSFHCIEKMEEGRINKMIILRDGNKLKTELERICTQIIKLQKKKLGQKDKIAFAHYRISNLEQIIKETQSRHQIDQEDL